MTNPHDNKARDEQEQNWQEILDAMQAVPSGKRVLDAYAESRVAEARLQDSTNVFHQFKEAMMLQDLSARPTKGTRFRTPLEELSIILSHITDNAMKSLTDNQARLKSDKDNNERE